MKQLKCKFFKTLVKDRVTFKIRMGNELWGPICGFSGDHKSYQCVDPLMAGWCANTSAMTVPSRFKPYFHIIFQKAPYHCYRFAVPSSLAPSTTASPEPPNRFTQSVGENMLINRTQRKLKIILISDTIVVRSKSEPVGWADAEAFFWREEACFPGRHTRWKKCKV